MVSSKDRREVPTLPRLGILSSSSRYLSLNEHTSHNCFFFFRWLLVCVVQQVTKMRREEGEVKGLFPCLSASADDALPNPLASPVFVKLQPIRLVLRQRMTGSNKSERFPMQSKDAIACKGRGEERGEERGEV